MYLAESCTPRLRPECGRRMHLSPLTSATPDGGRRPLGWPLRRSAARQNRGARLGREVLRQPGSLRARRGAATSTRGARRGAGQLWRGAAESRQQSRSASCPPPRCRVCPAAGALLQVRAKSSPRSVRLPGSAAMALCDHERHRAAAQLLRCPAPHSGEVWLGHTAAARGRGVRVDDVPSSRRGRRTGLGSSRGAERVRALALLPQLPSPERPLRRAVVPPERGLPPTGI